MRHPRNITVRKEQPPTLAEWMGHQRKELVHKLEDIRRSQASIPKDKHILSLLTEEDFEEMYTFMKEAGKEGTGLEVWVIKVSGLIQHSLERNLSAEEGEYVTQSLSDLFMAMNTSATGRVNWDEFHFHLLNAYVSLPTDDMSILPYDYKCGAMLPAKALTAGSKLQYIECIDNYLAINVYGPNPSTLTLTDPKHPVFTPYATAEHNLPYLSAQYLPSKEMVMASVQDNQLHFYRLNRAPTREEEERHQYIQPPPRLQLTKSVWLKEALLNMLWDDQDSMLYGCTRSGKMLTYAIEQEDPNILQTPMHTLQLHDGVITDIDPLEGFNPKRVATAGMDGLVKIVDMQHMEVVYEFAPGLENVLQTGIQSLSFSPDYLFIVTNGFTFAPCLWMPVHTKHRMIARLEDHDKPHQHQLLGAKVLPGSPQIITGDVSGMFKVWDIRYTGVVQTFDAEPQAITQQQQNKGHVKLVNYTLDLKRGGIVCTTTHTDDNTSKLGRHEPAHTVAMDPTKTHSGAVAAACFDSTANTFLTASGCEVKVWDSNKGTCVISFDDCVSSEITQLRVDKPGRRFIVGTHEGKVQAHGLGTGTVSHHFARHSKEVTFLHFDAMQYQVISAGLDGMLYFFPGDATEWSSASRSIRAPNAITSGQCNAHALVLVDTAGCVQIYDKQGSFLQCCHPNAPLNVLHWVPPNGNITHKPSTSTRPSSSTKAAPSSRPGSSSKAGPSPAPPPHLRGTQSESASQSQSRGSALPELSGRPPSAPSPKAGSRSPSSSVVSRIPKRVDSPSRPRSRDASRPGTSASRTPGQSPSRPGTGGVPPAHGGFVEGLPGPSVANTNGAGVAEAGVEPEEEPQPREHNPACQSQDLTGLSEAEINFATDMQLNYYLHDPEYKAQALACLTPYSGFVAADTQSRFTLWSMRPAPQAALFRWKAFTPVDCHFDSMATAMAWHLGTMTLWVADDQGFVSVWWLMRTLDQCFGSAFNGAVDTENEPQLQRCWRAHTSAVRNMQLLASQRNVITWAAHGPVTLWDFDGGLLGALQQGRGRRAPTALRAYHFSPSTAREPAKLGPSQPTLDAAALTMGSFLGLEDSDVGEVPGRGLQRHGSAHQRDYMADYESQWSPSVACPPPPPSTARKFSAYRPTHVVGYQREEALAGDLYRLDTGVKPLLARPLTAPSPLKPNRAELRVHDPWAVYRRVMSLRNLLWPPSGLLHRDSPECILPEVEHELRKLSAPDSDPEEGVREEEGRRRTASARKLANPVSMMTALPASALSNDTHSPDYAPSSNPNVQALVDGFTPWTATFASVWLPDAHESTETHDDTEFPANGPRPNTAPQVFDSFDSFLPLPTRHIEWPSAETSVRMSSRCRDTLPEAALQNEGEWDPEERDPVLYTSVSQVLSQRLNSPAPQQPASRAPSPMASLADGRYPALLQLMETDPDWPLSPSPYLSREGPPRMSMPTPWSSTTDSLGEEERTVEPPGTGTAPGLHNGVQESLWKHAPASCPPLPPPNLPAAPPSPPSPPKRTSPVSEAPLPLSVSGEADVGEPLSPMSISPEATSHEPMSGPLALQPPLAVPEGLATNRTCRTSTSKSQRSGRSVHGGIVDVLVPSQPRWMKTPRHTAQVPIPDDDGFELLFSAPKPLTHQAPRDLEATAGPPSNTSKSSMTPTPTSAASQGLSSEQLSSPHRNVDAILRQWTPPPSTTPTNRTSPNYFRAADRPRPGTLPDVSSLSKPAWQSYEAQQLKYSYAHEQLFGDQLRKVLKPDGSTLEQPVPREREPVRGKIVKGSVSQTMASSATDLSSVAVEVPSVSPRQKKVAMRLQFAPKLMPRDKYTCNDPASPDKAKGPSKLAKGEQASPLPMLRVRRPSADSADGRSSSFARELSHKTDQGLTVGKAMASRLLKQRMLKYDHMKYELQMPGSSMY